jgi:hypothetical protein
LISSLGCFEPHRNSLVEEFKYDRDVEYQHNIHRKTGRKHYYDSSQRSGEKSDGPTPATLHEWLRED